MRFLRSITGRAPLVIVPFMATAMAVSLWPQTAVNARSESPRHPAPAGCVGSSAACYFIVTVDDKANNNNYVTGIENDYNIVGAYSSDNQIYNSFWASPNPEPTTMVTPGYPTFSAEDDSTYLSTFLQGLNNYASQSSAYQVGYVDNGLVGGAAGVIYHGGIWTTISNPNQGTCAVTKVLAINDTLQGVGYYLKPTGGTCEPQAFEFYPSGSGFTYVDFSPPPPPSQAYVSSTANGINTLGDVVGTVSYGSPSQPHHAVWLYSELKYSTFKNGSDESFGQGLNFNDGVVGDYVDSSGTHGFLVQNPQAATPTFLALDASSHSPPYTVVNSINTAWAIAGWYADGSGTNHGFVGICGPCPNIGGAPQRSRSRVRTHQAHYKISTPQ